MINFFKKIFGIPATEKSSANDGFVSFYWFPPDHDSSNRTLHKVAEKDRANKSHLQKVEVPQSIAPDK